MKTKNKLVLSAMLIAFLMTNISTFAQVGIGTTTPNTNSLLDVEASNKGFLPPRLTTAERNTLGTELLITPDVKEKGMLVFDTDLTSYYYWNGTAWVAIAASGGGYVDLTTNQTIAGMKTFTGDLTPAGRLMIPMAELSYIRTLYSDGGIVIPLTFSSGNKTGNVGTDGMSPVVLPLAATDFKNDYFTLDSGGAPVTTPLATTKLKYTSGDPSQKFVSRYFHIALSFSFTPSAIDTYVFGVSRNTIVMDSSKLFLKGANTNDKQSSAMHVFLWLNDGDEIGFSVGRIATTGSGSIALNSFNFVAIGM